MPRKEFVRLMEENVLLLSRLSERLKVEPGVISEYPRQQLTMLTRLHLGGPAKLKDIARREVATTPNLCAMFRRMEKDGLIMRTIDENDRRNTWYSATAAGADIANRALEKFRESIETLFNGISREEEARLNGALRTINETLTGIKKRGI